MNAHLYPNFGAEEGDLPPSTAMPAPVVRLERLWARLFDDGGAFCDAAGLVPWLSTPRAQAEATRRALPLWGPAPDVVRTVHDKAFAVASDPHVVVFGPGTLTEDTFGAALKRLPLWAHDNWTLKPRFSTSGRGRTGSSSPGLAGALRRLHDRGAVLEPWFARVLDLSAQWRVDHEGLTLLGTTEQVVTPSGGYRGCIFSKKEGETPSADSPWDAAVVKSSAALVKRAAAVGFVGPCGVDAFVWRAPDGSEHLRICEFNARFTAGMVAVCLAPRQPHGQVRFTLEDDEPFHPR